MFFDRNSGASRGGGWDRERGGYGGHGGRGGYGSFDGSYHKPGSGYTNANEGYRLLVQEPGTHLLFIGSYSCVRHRGTERLQLQKEGKLTFLCLQDIDWITGDYLPQIEEAAQEVLQLYPDIKKLILFGGCQLELLSVDMKAVSKDLTSLLDIPVVFHKGCHLVGYGRDLEEDDT